MPNRPEPTGTNRRIAISTRALKVSAASERPLESAITAEHGSTEERVPASDAVEYLGGYANQIEHLEKRMRTLLNSDRCKSSPTVQSRPKRAARLSGTEEAGIAQKYQEGQSVYALAKEYGIHRVTISKILKRQGVNTRYKFMTEEMITRAVHLQQQGLPYKEIAKKLGVSDRTVSAALKRSRH